MQRLSLIWEKAERSARALLEPASDPSRRNLRFVVVGLIVAVWIAHAGSGPPIFGVDDAYITLHNAQVLWWGKDPQFHSSALAGSTSLIHLLAVATWIPLVGPLWAMHTAAWIGVLLYALGLLRLAEVEGASLAGALLLLGCGLLVGEIPHHLMNGLETGWALAGITWALAAARDRRRPTGWELPVLCGVLPFLRPELIALSGLLMLVRLAGLLRSLRGRALAREAARQVGLFAAAAAPCMLIYTVAIHSPFPTTIAAKRFWFAEGCWPPATKHKVVSSALRSFQQTLGFIAIAGVLCFVSGVGWAALVFSAILVGAYYLEFPGALGHYEQRYLYPLVPLILFGAASLLGRRQAVIRAAGLLLLGVGLAQSLVNLVPRWRNHLATCDFTRYELDGVARWVDEHVPKNEPVLVHDAGYIGFATHNRLFDVVGLKTPANIAEHARLTWPSCGARRNDAIAQINEKIGPRWVVVLKGWDKIFGITRSIRAAGHELTLRRDGAYEVYEVVREP
jgi:hypothetical protein